MNEIIGRVAATKKFPATMDKFYFWTDADFDKRQYVIRNVQLKNYYAFGIANCTSDISGLAAKTS